MSGGSVDPEGPDDYQCNNCGLWFHRVGVENHEDGCNYPDEADPINEIRDADELPAAGGSSDPPAPDDVDDVGGDDAQDARTDGAGLGLEGPPETSSDEEPSEAVDDDPADEENDDELQCTSCGDPLGVTDEDLREGIDGDSAQLTCTCGNIMEWTDD